MPGPFELNPFSFFADLTREHFGTTQARIDPPDPDPDGEEARLALAEQAEEDERAARWALLQVTLEDFAACYGWADVLRVVSLAMDDDQTRREALVDRR